MNPLTNNDCLSTMKHWPDGCCDMCVTSPPYYGLRSYSWGGDKSHKHKWSDLDDVLQGCSCGARRPLYGIEPTIEEYLAKTVEIFREVRRVLKDWGTLWLNIGDGYSGGGRGHGPKKQDTNAGTLDMPESGSVEGLADGQPLMMPERITLALQADGWILRSKIIWCKAWSFHDCNGRRITETGTDLFGDPYEDVILDERDYVGSCMPESVNGWRYSRHKVKMKAGRVARHGIERGAGHVDESNVAERKDGAQWSDCPGCKVCEPNGGLVLRQGSWRPTNSWEYLYLFSKSKKYYCDAESVKENVSENTHDRGTKLSPPKEGIVGHKDFCAYAPAANVESGRNLRSVWCIGTQAFKKAHFATFPEALVEPCIKAGTSEKGNCPKCGRPYARIIDSKQIKRDRPADRTSRHNAGAGVNSCGNTVAGVENTTLGWKPTCKCDAGDPAPAVVLDPFMGSGTVAVVAERLGRNWRGCEINPEYIAIAEKRLGNKKTMLV
jgi:DNA modification methylase